MRLNNSRNPKARSVFSRRAFRFASTVELDRTPFMELFHDDKCVIANLNGVELFRYVCGLETETRESPRPYFHPLRTLHGAPVSDFRPPDHLWHHGLSLTCAELSGENFWGGPTYTRKNGYQQLENNGTQRHIGWNERSAAQNRAAFEHNLNWITQSGARWIEEIRRIEIEASADCWILRWSSLLKNVSDRELEWGSPTTAGRDNAGYGGLFWRGARDFQNSELISGGDSEDEIMGQRAPWLAFIGQHATGAFSTVLMLDDKRNPRFPNAWFARSEATPMLAISPMFHEVMPHAAGETLELKYSVIFCDGKRTREELQALAANSAG